MVIRRLMEAFVLAAVVLFAWLPARGEDAGDMAAIDAAAQTVEAVADPAVEEFDDDSPGVRSYLRLTAMSLLTRAGADATTKFGLSGDEPAEAANGEGAPADADEKPYVVLIHGFNSSPERCATLLAPIRDAGFRCGMLRYPNDQSICDSAKLLSAELHEFANQNPGRKVSLLTYSMGGLVAREVIENKRLDPGNVTQLVMVAPPTHGSSCARIVCSGDIWEHGVRGKHGGLLNCVYACLEDGLGEARHDLKPDSPFLKRLNSRKLNPLVRYSIILGTAGPFAPSELAAAKLAVRKSAESSGFVRAIKPALDKALEDLSDAVEEGDGVVSVARGRLEGVPDTVLLGFNHWNVVDDPDAEVTAKVHREVLKRLIGKPVEAAGAK